MAKNWWESAPIVEKPAAAGGWESAPVVEPAATAAAPADEKSLFDSFVDRARASVTSKAGGAMQFLGDYLSPDIGPVSSEVEQVMGAIFPQRAPGAELIESAGIANELADAYRAEAGGVRPESVGSAIDDPRNAARYYGGILAEMVPDAAAVALTRNPRLGTELMSGLVGTQQYGENRADGAPMQQAVRDASSAAMFEGAGSRGAIEEAMGAGNFLRRFARAAPQEALGSAVEEGSQEAIPAIARGEEVPIGDILASMVDAAIVGGPTAAIEALGGAQAQVEQPPVQTEVENTPWMPPDDAVVVESPVVPTAPQPIAEAPASVQSAPAAESTIAPAPEAAQPAPELAQQAEVVEFPLDAEPAPAAPIQPPAAALYDDYNPEASQIETRVDGDLSFTENRLTRRALEDALTAPPEQGAERLLRNIAEQPDVTEADRWLANKLAPVMTSLGVKLAQQRADLPYAAAYDNRTNELWLRQADPNTALHEALHGATSALLTSSSAAANPVVNRVQRDFGDMLSYLQTEVGMGNIAVPEALRQKVGEKQGPLSNTKELLAYGMTEPGFRDWLRTLPPPPSRTDARNMWEAFKSAIIRLLGPSTPEQRSYLDALIESTAELVDFAEANPAATRVAQAGVAGRLAPGREPAPAPASPPAQPATAPPAASDAETTATPPAPATPPEPAPAPQEPTVDTPAAPAPEAAQTPPAATDPTPAADAGRPVPTSTKNRVMRAERESEGRDPIVEEASKTNEAAVEEARESLDDNPLVADEIVQRLNNTAEPRISPLDEAILLVRKVQLRNERDAAAKRAGDESLSEDQRRIAQDNWQVLEERINAIDFATYQSGRAWGQFGQLRQRMLREDFTLEAMERKLRAVTGAPLTPEQTKEVAALSKRIEALEKELDEANDKLGRAKVEQDVAAIFDKAVAEAGRTAKRKGASQARAALKERADKARADLKRKLSAGQFNSGIDPMVFYDLAIIGADVIADGVTTLADWTKRIKAEVGDAFDKIKGDLPTIYEKSKELHAAAESGGTPESVVAGIDPDDIRQRDVYDLVIAHIRAGLKGEDAVMRAVHGDLKAVAPEITERDVRRLFSDYGNARFPSKDADKAAARELRALVQLQESIDRLEEGLPALKSGLQRDKQTEAIRKKREQLGELLKQASKSTERTPDQLETYRQARADNLRKQIAELEDMIATGRRPAKKARPVKDAYVLNLEQLRNKLRLQLRQIDNPPRTADEIYQRGRTTSMKRQLAEVQKRIATNDYAKRPRRVRELNKENKRIAYELDREKAKFAEMQFLAEMEKRSPVMKALAGIRETLNLARAAMTSIDLSAILRQGGFVVLGHPVRAIKALPEMARATVSEAEALSAEQDIQKRPNARLYKQAGLSLTTSDGYKLTDLEEKFMSRWLQRSELREGQPVRNVGRRVKDVALAPVRASGRAFTTFLNRLRADSFDTMLAAFARNGDAPTMQEITAIARFINAATGRGRIGSNDNAAVGLNTVFFAPKLVASRFQLLTGSPAWGEGRRVQKAIIAEYARFLTGVATVYGLGYLAYLAYNDEDDDKPFIEFDPRSTAFGKMRFGKTYIDPLAGMAQVTTFLTKLVTGEKMTGAGEVVGIRDEGRLTNLLYETGQYLDHAGFNDLASVFPAAPDDKKVGFGGPDADDTIVKFLRTKLAPVPGFVWNRLAGGKNVIGQEVTVAEDLRQLVTPMSLGNVRDIMADMGVPAGAAIFTLEMLGMGVQFRDPVAFDAPDYGEMDFDQKRAYGEYSDAVDNLTQSREELAAFAQSLPKDYTAYDIKGAVEEEAERLGIPGVTVRVYSRKTTARDDYGRPKRGLILSESGKVQLENDDAPEFKDMRDTQKSVSDLNDAIKAVMDRGMNNAELREIMAPYMGEGYVVGDDDERPNGDLYAESLLILQNQRADAQAGFVERLNGAP